MELLANWVTEFNRWNTWITSIKVGLLLKRCHYNESLADDNPYEGKLDKLIPVFHMI
jgi:hypothetical protein